MTKMWLQVVRLRLSFADKTAENFYLWYGKGTNDYQLVTVTLSKPATNPRGSAEDHQIVDGDKKSNVVEIAEDATSATVEMPADYKIADAKNVTVNVTASDSMPPFPFLLRLARPV